jgi:hypothetical protein
MLDRDCGEDRVHDKRAGGLFAAYKTAGDIPVPLVKNAGGWLGKSEGDRCFGLKGGGRSNTRGFVAILRRARRVGQAKADEIGPREQSFEPDSAFLMLLGSRIISIEQQVGVGEISGKAGPPTCSMSFATCPGKALA